MFNTSKESKKAAGAGADKPGEHAKIIGKELRKLNPVLNRDNASVVIINQIRQKIGVMYGSPDTKASGGRSLEYYCSLSLKTKASKKLKDDRDNVKGILVAVENTKNKCFRPFVEAPGGKDVGGATLLFDEGINPLGGLLDCLYKQYRIDKALGDNGKPKAGWWTVRPEFSGGETVTFQGSLEKNLVPVEVLLKCPKLIDAESTEQVQDYLNSFGVLNASEQTFQEQDIKEGEDLDMDLAG